MKMDALGENGEGMGGELLAAADELLHLITVGQVQRAGKLTVKMLKSADKWYGVTYAADKPVVVAALADLTKQGKYPDGLWK